MLSGWANFYVITGSGAAALTGLMFVVITLVSQNRAQRRSNAGISIFSTPTLVHFGEALYVSAILTAPWRVALHASVAVVIGALYGLCHVSYVAARTRRVTEYKPQLDDWAWYAVLPLIAYLLLLAGAVRFVFAAHGGPFVIGAGVLLLLFIGIHNAWDVVTYLTLTQDDDEP